MSGFYPGFIKEKYTLPVGSLETFHEKIDKRNVNKDFNESFDGCGIFEHYLRRNNRFYFRTIDKKNTVSFLIPKNKLEVFKKRFPYKKTFVFVLNNPKGMAV